MRKFFFIVRREVEKWKIAQTFLIGWAALRFNKLFPKKKHISQRLEHEINLTKKKFKKKFSSITSNCIEERQFLFWRGHYNKDITTDIFSPLLNNNSWMFFKVNLAIFALNLAPFRYSSVTCNSWLTWWWEELDEEIIEAFLSHFMLSAQVSVKY